MFFTTLKESVKLLRLHQPAGAILLLLPMLLGLSELPSVPSFKALMLCLGVIAVRSFGCIVNDICDREIDAQVQRTASRPLAAGTVSVFWAIFLAAVTGTLSLATIAWVPTSSYPVVICCAFLIVLYPLSKRFFFFPQLILGLAFASSIPCVFSFFEQPLTGRALHLTITVIFWVICFDTSYALADYEDDQHLDIRSAPKTIGYQRSLSFISILLFLVQSSMSILVISQPHLSLLAKMTLNLSWLVFSLMAQFTHADHLSHRSFYYHCALGLLWLLSLTT